MIKDSSSSDVDKEYSLEYYNTIGLLFKNHLFINDRNKILEFDIQEIKSLVFKKDRNIKINYLLFIIANFFLLFSFFLNDISFMFCLIKLALTTILYLFAITIKIYHYRIILLTKDSHYFNIQINKAYKDEASDLISKSKTKIK